MIPEMASELSDLRASFLRAAGGSRSSDFRVRRPIRGEGRVSAVPHTLRCLLAAVSALVLGCGPQPAGPGSGAKPGAPASSTAQSRDPSIASLDNNEALQV